MIRLAMLFMIVAIVAGVLSLFDKSTKMNKIAKFLFYQSIGFAVLFLALGFYMND